MRFVVLLGMAAFTHWKIGKAAAVVLAVAAAIIGVLAIMAYL